jgi:hypothetical protein
MTTFYDGLTSRPMWASLHQRLLPQDNWFGVPFIRQFATAPSAPAAVPPQTTGSLPAAEGPAKPATP